MSVDLPDPGARALLKRRPRATKADETSDEREIMGRAASALDQGFEFTVDRDWRITSITPRTAAWCGWSTVEGLVGRDSREVWAPPSQAVADALEAAFAKSATSSVITQPSQFAPGRWVQIVVGPSADGARLRFEDITSRLSAEDRQTVDETGSYSLGAGPTEICILDRRGVIVSANSAWRAGLVAHSVAVANGGHGMRYAQVCKAVIPELDEVAFQQRLDGLLAGQVGQFEATFGLTTAHGQELRQVQIAPLQDGDTTYFAAIHEDLTERARILATLHETSDQLLHAQEQERQRIAVELHDSTSQHLAGLVLGLEQLRRDVGQSASGAQTRIDEMSKLVQQTIRETRVLSYLMNASGREREGLETSVRRFVEGFGRRTGLEARFESGGPVDAISAAVQHAVFRVVQEALANVHRHARATKTSVRLASQEGVLSVRISDNGRGLRQVTDGEPRLGVGIPGMRARIEQLGGDLRIMGSPSGTVVHASVPLRLAAARAHSQAG